jgi:hypothetical protein
MLDADIKMKVSVSDTDRKFTMESERKIDLARRTAFERLPDEIIQQ